jgi:hypothetical protein
VYGYMKKRKDSKILERIQGVLEHTQHAILNKLDEDDRSLVKRAMLSLTTKDGKRLEMTLEELTKKYNVDESHIREIVNDLERYSLIASRVDGEDIWIKLFHDLIAQFIRKNEFILA